MSACTNDASLPRRYREKPPLFEALRREAALVGPAQPCPACEELARKIGADGVFRDESALYVLVMLPSGGRVGGYVHVPGQRPCPERAGSHEVRVGRRTLLVEPLGDAWCLFRASPAEFQDLVPPQPRAR